jgi:hypothetical protein
MANLRCDQGSEVIYYEQAPDKLSLLLLADHAGLAFLGFSPLIY